MEIMEYIIFLAGGMFLLLKGADWFVDGAEGVANRFGVSQLVIGLSVVAFGTSIPEAAVSIHATRNGLADISVGNVVGSNIFNVLFILGITALFSALRLKKSLIQIEIPFMILCTVFLFALGFMGKLTRLGGILMLVLFVAYLIYLFLANMDSDEPSKRECRKMPKLLIIAALGLLLVIVGSRLAVLGATEISRMLGVSERVIALTIVAIGTSLPELFTSCVAARKGNPDIAVGNIVGSNIFNILFIVGVSACMRPLVFEPKFIIDTGIAIWSGILLWILAFCQKKLTFASGIILVINYLGFFMYLYLQKG